MTASTAARPEARGHATQGWRRPPRPGLLAGMSVGAIGFELAVQHPVGLATTVGMLLLILAGVVGGWFDDRPHLGLLLAAAAPAAMLTVRTSVWLVPLNLAATLGLLALAAMIREEQRPVGRALRRMISPTRALEPAVMSLDLVAQAAIAAAAPYPGVSTRAGRIGRGLAVATPVVVALIATLAAADALFASLVDRVFDPASLIEHAWLLFIGFGATAVLAAHREWKVDPSPSRVHRFFGGTEAALVLGGIIAVYAAFAATQVVAIAGGSAYVTRTTGLTYAEYAREGFFQLLAAALITLTVLLLLRRHTAPVGPRASRSVLALQEATIGLTLIVVAVALRRLFLYEAEFGLTMLRLSTIVFAAWVGIVFVVLGLHLAGRLRIELPVAVLASAFVVLLAVNAANPEALVASRNIDRFGGTDELDVDYLVHHLGPDAAPAIVADPYAAAVWCNRTQRPDDRPWVFNLGRSRAAAVHDETCS